MSNMARTVHPSPFAETIRRHPPVTRQVVLAGLRPDLHAAVAEVEQDPTGIRSWRSDAAVEICGYLSRAALIGVARVDLRAVVRDALRHLLPVTITKVVTPHRAMATQGLIDQDGPGFADRLCTQRLDDLCPATVVAWVAAQPDRAALRRRICRQARDLPTAAAVLALDADTDTAGLTDQAGEQPPLEPVAGSAATLALLAVEFHHGPVPGPLAELLVATRAPLNQPRRGLPVTWPWPLTPDAARVLLASGQAAYVGWAVEHGMIDDDTVIATYAAADSAVRHQMLRAAPHRELAARLACEFEFDPKLDTDHSVTEVLDRWPDLPLPARIRILRDASIYELRDAITGWDNSPRISWQPGEVTTLIEDLAAERD
jgi:hypothetical protein